MNKISTANLRSIWWAFYWRTFLIGSVVGFLGGGAAGLIVTVAGMPELGTAAGMVVGAVTNAVVTFFTLRMALEKRYEGFSISIDSGQASAFD